MDEFIRYFSGFWLIILGLYLVISPFIRMKYRRLVKEYNESLMAIEEYERNKNETN